MNRRARVIVITLVVLSGVVAAGVAPMFSRAVQQSQAATPGAAGSHPTGPEADPYLRHVPGGYDIELELPPDEMQ